MLLQFIRFQADTITFDKAQSNNFFYAMLRTRKEGKLETFAIPNNVVKDDSGTTYTNYLGRDPRARLDSQLAAQTRAAPPIH